MYYKTIILALPLLAVTAVSCQDSYDAGDVTDTDYVSNDDTRPATTLDVWLRNNFTNPYNIDVKYYWDASEVDIYKTLVPPKTSQVQPVMDVVKKVWIDTYSELAGEAFIKQYCPKQFVLVGSARYNFDGTITLGTAEGGRKVVLYVVNDFVQKDAYAVKEMMHTIEHEFAHILHQTKPYAAEFRQLTPGDYTANWNTFSVSAARQRGFITNYAMLSPDEDFAEMVAMMLVEGKEGYENILRCYTSASAEALIRKKEQLVVEYFESKYGIDFYALQTKVQEAIRAFAPDAGGENPNPVPALDAWGFNKTYTTLHFDLSVLSEPADFASRYAYDNAKLHTAGFSLDYGFKLFWSGAEQLTLRLYYYADVDGNRVYSEANFYLVTEWNADGTVTLFFDGADANGDYLNYDLIATGLLSFFANRTFTVDWVASCNGSASTYIGLYPTENPKAYAFGKPGL